MKIEISRAGRDKFGSENEKPCLKAFEEGDEWFVNIETLEDLINLCKEVNDPLVVDLGRREILGSIVNHITIYDDYLE